MVVFLDSGLKVLAKVAEVSWSFNRTKDTIGTGTIEVPTIPDGAYFVKLYDEDGQFWYSAVIDSVNAKDTGFSVSVKGVLNLLSNYQVPKQWRRWTGQTLQAAILDHLNGFSLIRATTKEQLVNYHAISNVEIDAFYAGDAALARIPYLTGKRFVASGFLEYTYDLGAPLGQRYLRWTEQVGAKVGISIQSIGSDSPITGTNFTGVTAYTCLHSDNVAENETLGAPIDSTHRYVAIRINLSYDDATVASDLWSTTIDVAGVPTQVDLYGFTPILSGFELVSRVATPFVPSAAPSLPTVLTDYEAGGGTLLDSLRALQKLYTFSFDAEIIGSQIVFSFASSFESNKTASSPSPILLRKSKNTTITGLKKPGRPINVLHCYGSGSGADQLYVRIPATGTLDNFPPVESIFEDSNLTSIADLTTDGTNKLVELNSSNTFEVVTSQPARLWDKVTIIDPDSGTSTDLVVCEEKIEHKSGISRTLGIGGLLPNPIRRLIQSQQSAPSEPVPPVPSQVTATAGIDLAVVRWMGNASRYMVYWQKTGGAWEKKITTANSIVLYLDHDVVYTFKVSALYGFSGETACSDTATCTPIKAPTVAEVSAIRYGDIVDHAILRAKLEAGFLAEHDGLIVNLAQEITDRIAAIGTEASTRYNDIAAEAAARGTALTAEAAARAQVATDLAAETTARVNAIVAEASARAADFQAEHSARIAALAGVQAQIDVEKPKVTSLEDLNSWAQDLLIEKDNQFLLSEQRIALVSQVVEGQTTRISSVEVDVGSIKSTVAIIEPEAAKVSTIEQNVDSIRAEVFQTGYSGSKIASLGVNIDSITSIVSDLIGVRWAALLPCALNYRINGGGSSWLCTTAGTTGATQPVWPNSGTVTDGTVVWTYQGSYVADLTQLQVNTDRIASIVANGGYWDSATPPVFHPTAAYSKALETSGLFSRLLGSAATPEAYSLQWATKTEIANFVTGTDVTNTVNTATGALTTHYDTVISTIDQKQDSLALSVDSLNSGTAPPQISDRDAFLAWLDAAHIESSAQFLITKSEILMEVARAGANEDLAFSRIQINADAITSEVIRASASEGVLGSRITQTADDINLNVFGPIDPATHLRKGGAIDVAIDAVNLAVFGPKAADGTRSGGYVDVTAAALNLAIIGDATHQGAIKVAVDALSLAVLGDATTKGAITVTAEAIRSEVWGSPDPHVGLPVGSLIDNSATAIRAAVWGVGTDQLPVYSLIQSAKDSINLSVASLNTQTAYDGRQDLYAWMDTMHAEHYAGILINENKIALEVARAKGAEDQAFAQIQITADAIRQAVWGTAAGGATIGTLINQTKSAINMAVWNDADGPGPGVPSISSQLVMQKESMGFLVKGGSSDAFMSLSVTLPAFASPEQITAWQAAGITSAVILAVYEPSTQGFYYVKDPVLQTDISALKAALRAKSLLGSQIALDADEILMGGKVKATSIDATDLKIGPTNVDTYLQAILDAKELPSGSQAKANAAQTAAQNALAVKMGFTDYAAYEAFVLAHGTIIDTASNYIRTGLIDVAAIKAMSGFFDNITSKNATLNSCKVSGTLTASTIKDSDYFPNFLIDGINNTIEISNGPIDAPGQLQQKISILGTGYPRISFQAAGLDRSWNERGFIDSSIFEICMPYGTFPDMLRGRMLFASSTSWETVWNLVNIPALYQVFIEGTYIYLGNIETFAWQGAVQIRASQTPYMWIGGIFLNYTGPEPPLVSDFLRCTSSVSGDIQIKKIASNTSTHANVIRVL